MCPPVLVSAFFVIFCRFLDRYACLLGLSRDDMSADCHGPSRRCARHASDDAFRNLMQPAPLLPLVFRMPLSNLNMMAILQCFIRPRVALRGDTMTRFVHGSRGCQAFALSVTTVLTREPPGSTAFPSPIPGFLRESILEECTGIPRRKREDSHMVMQFP